MTVLIPVVLQWWQALPADKVPVDRLESRLGIVHWRERLVYPNGNALLDKPASEDPTTGLRNAEPPARGVVQIGYAAVKTAGIRAEGQITERDLAEVANRHLEDLSREAARLGVPREKLFTHGAGWEDGEPLYQGAVNQYSCPGWSFYRYAAEPHNDAGVQEGRAARCASLGGRGVALSGPART